MKNLIKISAVIFVITIGVIAFNCSGSTSEATNDSTAVSLDTVVVDSAKVDTTKVSGGAGLEGGNAPQR